MSKALQRDASSRAYTAKRRAAAKLNGMCSECCIRKREPSRAKCAGCLAAGRRMTPTGPFCVRCCAFHKPGAHTMQWRLLRRAA